MAPASPGFAAPSPVERLFNRVFGLLVGLGLGLPHNYLLEVRGRRSELLAERATEGHPSSAD